MLPQRHAFAQPCAPQASRCGSIKANCAAAMPGMPPSGGRSRPAPCSFDYAAAADALHRALEISPSSTFSNFYLGALQLEQSDPQAALASFRKVDSEVFRLTGIAVAEHTLGDAAASQAALDEIIAKHSRDAAAQIAEVYAWRNEKDKAFEWLDRAFNNRDGGLTLIKNDVFYKNIHNDPRYPAFLRKNESIDINRSRGARYLRSAPYV
jgi:tetratricopeptide (TPR) repeat protein